MIDWGEGRYERTAAELEPAAGRVVEAATVAAGQRVLDLACGTGNAALAAARAGAEVAGLDAAPRLLEVARERLRAEGFDAALVVGDLHDLPFPDASFDVVLSVFGVIFAADPDRAVAEIGRVMRSGGRAVVSAWIPAGAIDAMVLPIRRAMAEATGFPGPDSMWSDTAAVTALAARHGLRATFADASLVIVGGSPEEYWVEGEAHHPMSRAWRPVLERAGTYEAVRAQAIAALRAANESPDRFRATVPYRIIRLAHG